MKSVYVLLGLGVATLLGLCALSAAGYEHPHAMGNSQDVMLAQAEHPKEHPTAGGEHPAEHPKPVAEKAKALSKEQLAAAITDYVSTDAKLKGGYFLLYDKEADKVLTLTLEKVHQDRLANTGGGVYFVCADFKDKDGTVYDLDFWMKQTAKGLKTTEITVHKVAGKPRYNWVEEKGTWKQAPVEK